MIVAILAAIGGRFASDLARFLAHDASFRVAGAFQRLRSLTRSEPCKNDIPTQVL
jgi:hypothetical protein